MKILIGSLMFLTEIDAFSQEMQNPFFLKQINISDDIAIVAGTGVGGLEVNQVLLATFADGSQCSLRIKEKHEPYLVVSLKDCSQKMDLRLQQGLEVSMYQAPRSAEAASLGAAVDTAEIQREEKEETEGRANDWLFTSDNIESSAGFTAEHAFDISMNLSNVRSEMRIDDLNLKTRTVANGFDLSLQYGISSWLNMGVSMPYLLSRVNDAAGTDSTTARGAGDLQYSIAIQPVRQATEVPINVIGYFKYSPKMIDSKYDNAGDGYSKTDMGLILSHSTKKAEVGLIFNYHYDDIGEGSNKAGGKWYTDSFDSYRLIGFVQFALKEHFSFYGGIGVESNSNSRIRTDEADGTYSHTLYLDPHTVTGAALGLKFAAIPDRTLFFLEVETTKMTDGKGTLDVAGTSARGKIDEVTITGLTLGFKYRF